MFALARSAPIAAAAAPGAAGDAAKAEVDAANEMTEAATIDLNIPVPFIRLESGKTSQWPVLSSLLFKTNEIQFRSDFAFVPNAMELSSMPALTAPKAARRRLRPARATQFAPGPANCRA
jgi:hypothetical protein